MIKPEALKRALSKNAAKYPSLLILIAILFIGINSCTVSYSFTGASISPDVKTFAINEFVTRAPNITPTYPEYVVEELRNKFIRQTSLSTTQTNPDLEFEGSITGFEIRPMSIQDGEQEALNRLTVNIQVKFTNNKNHDQDFDTSFSHFSDFPSSSNFADVEDQLLKIITEQIIDQIFNKSVANW